MSHWFRTYGFAEVAPNLLAGAYPLDDSDVAMLQRLGVERVLNLVEEEEYGDGERETVTAALAGAGIEEQRQSVTDYATLPTDELEAATVQVCRWLAEGHRTYLHCRAGWQRSAAVAAGVIALTEQVDIEDALVRLERRKPTAQPLPHQLDGLRAWWRARSEGSELTAHPPR